MPNRLLVCLLLLAAGGSSSLHAQWYNDYKSLDQYYDRLDQFVNDYPTLASVSTLGTTWEGREIRALKLTSPSATPKKAVVWNGMQHAREWVTGMVAMYAADNLLAGYGSDTRITNILDELEVYVVPVTNPDGYEFSRLPGERLWRKNRRPSGGGQFGVDLNRNWGYEWGHNSGSSSFPGSETYRGPSAFSEPETQAMRDLFLAQQNVISHADIHSYGQEVLTPWGYTDTEVTPDHALFQQVAGEMADAIFSVHGEVYDYGPVSTQLYLVSGGSHDWTYGDQGAYAFGFEVRPSSFFPGFELPPSEILPTSEEMFAALLHMSDFTITLANGDFDYSHSHTCGDIDLMYQAIMNGSNKAEFDMNGDGIYSEADIAPWLTEAGLATIGSGFLLGDANLDGNVDGADFLVWNSNKFTATPSWCSGDFNADGQVDGGDFLVWNANKFMAAAVPEPTGALLMLVGLLALRERRR